MFNVRLHRARKAAGLSLRDLGGLVGISHAAIRKYENGMSMPSSDILIKLSRALNVRTEYFFRSEVIALKDIEFRKHDLLPKKLLNTIIHKVNDQIERRMELENLFPQSPVKAFTAVDDLPISVEEMDEIEYITEHVRDAWDLGFGPIPDLIDVLETHGIRVFMIDSDNGHMFDGLAARVNGMPIVVVSRHWPGDRQRFTLAHELGHLILEGRLTTDLDTEVACDRFAGAFLFPRPAVLQELGEHRNALEIKEIGILKEEFGLSMAGILYRARDLGIISLAYRNDLAKLFRINGWQIKEPGQDYPAENARLFEQLVFHALAEGYIGESKAAELMNMSLLQFRRVRSMGGTEEPPCAAVNQ